MRARRGASNTSRTACRPPLTAERSRRRYLPDESTREAITARFWEYNGMCRKQLWSKFGAHQHWAKIELPDDAAAAAAVRRRLAERFPVDAFNRARRTLDPHNILANDLVDSLLGDPREEAYAKRGG